MITFAAIELNPAAIMGWLAIGAACGWLAIKTMQSPSYGDFGDFVLGGVGALAGGFGYSMFASGWPSFVFALIVACCFVGSGRAIAAWKA